MDINITITISETKVVNAAPSCLNMGMKKKFKKMFIQALIIDETKITLSFFSGKSTEVARKDPTVEKTSAVPNIFNEKFAPTYSIPENTIIISLDSKNSPNEIGIENTIKLLKRLLSNLLYESILLLAKYDESLGNDTNIIADNNIFNIEYILTETPYKPTE